MQAAFRERQQYTSKPSTVLHDKPRTLNLVPCIRESLLKHIDRSNSRYDTNPAGVEGSGIRV